ncbi:cell surface glycoprotein 1-like isoform X2 [Galleria mellonella]|uniref:Cell surface glycoprotein 1-like isoform X2 n=1 Tax=Galleria mellonella TaxID=7137 RepID=A0ABM3M9E4_GALME|nr:cell surface glycoprotein 1-like isoform X2 [Galleria mellonella]
MKIPDSTSNVGAYYGNDENGQWQPNGVMIESGVGGGVVGGGDAGPLRPPLYPVHLPRGHIPGYVMAGAYYPPAPYAPVPPPQDDFADYMWMENEEEFDKQVMQQLEEEALMEQCIEAMLEDEQRERHRPVANGHNHHYPTTSNGNPSLSLEETVSRSTLNPLAAEFVPTSTRARPTPTVTPSTTTNTENKSDKTESTEASSQDTPATEVSTDQVDSSKDTEQSREDFKTEVSESTPPTETPEVSAADIQTDKRKDKKDSKKVDPKKTVKQEVKKAKPVVVKSETKVQPKKKEVKVVKSETKVEEKTPKVEEPAPEVVQPQLPSTPTPVDEPATTTPGIKPINYAAAAKANKPKKPTTPPATDKTTPPPVKTEKKPEPKAEIKKSKTDKPVAKTEKPAVQRKNSAK